ncbi:MAG: helix-turn-helix transcriptional regulator [Clostridia bacterium]
MSNFFDAEVLTYPTLLSLSKSTEQSERTVLCSPHTACLLCAYCGDCLVHVLGRTVHLIGTRMVLLFGETAYRITKPTADFMLTKLEMALAPENNGCYSMAELFECYPDMKRFCRRNEQCLVFYDSLMLVLPTLQSIHAYYAYEPAQRTVQITLTLCYLLALITSSSWEDELTVKNCNKHVRIALQYIHENYMCNITTADIAEHVGVHIGHLHRLFLAETNCRLGEYITALRINKAKSLLMRTDVSTLHIAHIVGISTLQYFCRVFKQQVGVTPQTFRKTYNLTCCYNPDRMQYVNEEAPEGMPSAKEDK